MFTARESIKILTVSRESRQLIDTLIKQLFCPNLNFQKLNEIILEFGCKSELLDASESWPFVSISRRRQSSSILSALFLDIIISSNVPSFLKLPKIWFAFVFKTSSYYKITHWLQIMEGKDVSLACLNTLFRWIERLFCLKCYFFRGWFKLLKNDSLLNYFCTFVFIVTSFYNKCIWLSAYFERTTIHFQVSFNPQFLKTTRHLKFFVETTCLNYSFSWN